MTLATWPMKPWLVASMARFAKAWPCLASATLLNAAFPPFNLGLLVLCALVPWLASLRDVSGKDGFKSGWTFGFLFMLGQFFWIFSFVDRWVQNPLLAIVPYLAACAAAALYFGLTGWLTSLAWRANMPWAIPIAWAGVEVFRSYIPILAFPYGLVATPLWPYPWMIQNAFYGSIFLVGAWVLLLNVTLTLVLGQDASWRKVRGYVAASVLLLLASWVKYYDPQPEGRAIITVGQPGVDMAFGTESDQAELGPRIQSIIDRAQLHQSELLVLPEGVAGPSGAFPPLPPFAIPEGMPILFGGQRGQGPRYQAAFSYDGQWRYVDKTRLVIFGEYVPFREALPWLAASFNLPGGDLTPGANVSVMKVGKYTVGPILCFEGLFPDIAYRQARDGAQILAVMSVDDWYMGTTAPDQLKAASVWRAVETGLPLVRAASTGYSLAVDPRGNLVSEAPTKELVAFRVELPVGTPAPSPVFPIFPIAALSSLVLLPLACYQKKKSPRA